MSGSLGPQCLTCKKRQVRCDSTKPFCHRCPRDGRECPGYIRPLKVIRYEAPRKGKARQQSSLKHGPDLEGAVDTKAIIPRIPRHDPDYLALLESFQYYEDHVLPRALPADALFQRPKIDRQVPWHVLPSVLQHCMILSLRSMRADANSPDPQNRTDLCRYRGLGLSKLRDILSAAVTDPNGLALGCVLLMMGADLILSPVGSWTTHFEAAQRIISLRGGMRHSLDDQPHSKHLLVNFIVADIMSTTTTHSVIIANRFSMQPEYLGLIPSLEDDLMQSGRICPISILMDICQINAVRAGFSIDQVDAIRSNITDFKADVWTAAILTKHNSGSDFGQNRSDSRISESLSGLATCYKLAALLYLGLAVLDGADNIAELVKASRELNKHFTALFDLADADFNGPLETQLWRFISWPLFISAYATIGWSINKQYSDGLAAANAEISRIRACGTAQHSRRLTDAADYLNNILQERMNKNTWTWNEGFPFRCLFVI